jgi:hypothetical protein
VLQQREQLVTARKLQASQLVQVQLLVTALEQLVLLKLRWR